MVEKAILHSLCIKLGVEINLFHVTRLSHVYSPYALGVAFDWLETAPWREPRLHRAGISKINIRKIRNEPRISSPLRPAIFRLWPAISAEDVLMPHAFERLWNALETQGEFQTRIRNAVTQTAVVRHLNEIGFQVVINHDSGLA